MTMEARTYDPLLNNESDPLLQVADEELTRLFPHRCIRRVLLVTPPDGDVTLFNYATGKRGRYWNFASYGFGVIATHLRSEGLVIQVVNLNHEVLKACHASSGEQEFDFERSWKTRLASELSTFQPDLIGVTCMFTQTHRSLINVCNEIKRWCPTIPIAVGGVHITNSFVNTKTSENLTGDLSSVDFFFLYEAEVAFKHFVKVVNRDLQTRELAQVFFNAPKLHFTYRAAPKDEELNVIPAHDLLDTQELSRYGQVGSFAYLREPDDRLTTVLSNRGCRAQCTFCSVRNFNGFGVRARSVESVVEELLLLRHTYGVRHIMWLDDDFLYNHDRALRLFQEMVRQHVDITWDCSNGVIAAACTEDLVAAAVESGCIGLVIGMESGNPQILRDVKKPGAVKHFLKAAELLRKHEEIESRVFLMLGFPGETFRMILDTINVASEMNLDWYNITILQPLPNTPIFETMIRDGLLKDVNFQEIRFSSGAYGKHRKIAEASSQDLSASNFKDTFNNVDLDTVPTKEQLDTIWAYMNYHLNLKRLFRENRPIKLKQLVRRLRYVCDVAAPESPFAVYFYGHLQHKLFGSIDQRTIQLLEERLASSPYWQQRFDEFGLSIDHLRTGVFPVGLTRGEPLTLDGPGRNGGGRLELASNVGVVSTDQSGLASGRSEAGG